MLSFFAICDGRRVGLDGVLTAVIDSDLSVPADSLSLTVPYDKELAEGAEAVEAVLDGAVVFRGRLDSIVTVKERCGVLLRLSARSPAAALVDNEAEPVTYHHPNARLVANRHLLPFGITPADADSIQYQGDIKIDKGMSHWQVLKSFCRNRYASLPRITGGGEAYLKGLPRGKAVVFSDLGEGVAYHSLYENQKRWKLLSEVRLKLSGSGAYLSRIQNPNPQSRSAGRVRYVNAAADKTTVLTAEKMLQNSNTDSYSLQLKCAGCRLLLLGSEAVVRDSVLGELDGLTVQKVRYTADDRGDLSKVTLVKEKF